ncbi:MAG: interleukin-like EMT inducer domain-containing protein [Prevotella sp.]
MAKKVMGAFSVRWHKDGQDGSNVWLKYAEQLDLYDTATEKHYPSKVYDSPTSNCKYLGIGKGVGAEPIGGIYYTWSKYAGDDGTSFIPKGQAVAHHASLTAYNSATKSAGLHLVDNSGGALLKYWSGSATTDRTCTDGDGYTTGDKHLWVKDGSTWNDLGEIQGPKGDNAYLDYIELKGTSYSSSGTPGATINVKRNGVVTSRSVSSRGLTVYTINRSTLEITATRTFDTYGDTSLSSTMATYINGISDAYFVAIVSYDACGFNNTLISVLKNYGGSDIADYTIKRQAFAFLGYKGMAQGIAPQVLNIGEAKTADIISSVIDGLCQGKGQDGATGHGWVASVDRNEKFTEAQWGTYGTTGHTETWADTESVRNGCRVGDIFLVYGQATDSHNGHNAFYQCTNSSGNLAGTCISHTISPKGDKGDDAYNYKLKANIAAIPLGNDGYPSIASDSSGHKSLVLTAYIYKGVSSISVSSDYSIYTNVVYNNGNSSSSTTSQGGSHTRYLESYQNISKIQCSFKKGSTVLDSFDILPIKAGAAGVSYFPNMRGYWETKQTYSWEGMSRDMVVYQGASDDKPYLYAVKTAGKKIEGSETSPDNDSGNWEKASSPFSMLFANFVYTDNASVGGFVFSAEQMRSVSTNDGKSPAKDGSNCNILIDGNSGLFKANRVELTGTINATGGSIGEFTILDKGLGLTCTADEADISMTCKSNTKRRARIYVTPKYDNAVIYASTDTKTAAQFYAWESSGTALKVDGKTTINGAVNITGDITLSGLFSGLRLSTTTMSSTGTIPSGSDVICFTNSSSITVTMPSASTYKGRILFLKKTGSGGVTLNGSFVESGGTGNTATSREHVGNAKSMIYVSNGAYWIEFYCG